MVTTSSDVVAGTGSTVNVEAMTVAEVLDTTVDDVLE